MEKEKSDIDMESVLYDTLRNLEFLNELIFESHSIQFSNYEHDRLCSFVDSTLCNLNDLEKEINKKEEE